MATIPLGNFDAPRTLPEPRRSSVDQSGSLAAGRAMESAGQTLTNIGERGMQIEDQRVREEAAAQEREAGSLRRVRMANGAADYELQVDAARQAYEARMQAGQVEFHNAAAGWSDVVGKLPAPILPTGLEPAEAEEFNGAIGRVKTDARLKVAGVIGKARRAESTRQADEAFARIEQIAALPGRKAETAIASNHALLPLLRDAGLDEAKAAEQVRNADARVWNNEVQGRINAGEEDPEALQAVHSDLSDEKGRYVDKIDPGKRLTLAATIQGKIEALQQRRAVAAEHLSTVQDQTLGQIDEQIASAIPATPEQWSSWSDVFKDSPRRAELEQRLQEEQAVQALLRKPVADQQTALQSELQRLQSDGGDKHAIALYNKLQSAVDANLKQLQEQPLLWAQSRLHITVEPLDIAGAVEASTAAANGQPSDPIRLGAQLRQRLALNESIRKQLGPQVRLQPLLPQERGLIVGMLDKMPPKQAASMFGVLRQSIGSDRLYSLVMDTIAPDSPVRAMAGRLSLEQQRAPAQSIGSAAGAYGDVALTLLRGEALLNPETQTKAQDGKRVAFPMPAPNLFRDELSRRLGEAFAGRPEDLNAAVQGVRAYYAAKASDGGDIGGVMDRKRLQLAINAVVGERAHVEGKDVIAPWGMDADTFADQADVYIQARLKAAGLEDTGNVALLNVAGRPGAYVLVRGLESLRDRNGAPLVIHIGGAR